MPVYLTIIMFIIGTFPVRFRLYTGVGVRNEWCVHADKMFWFRPSNGPSSSREFGYSCPKMRFQNLRLYCFLLLYLKYIYGSIRQKHDLIDVELTLYYRHN